MEICCLSNCPSHVSIFVGIVVIQELLGNHIIIEVLCVSPLLFLGYIIVLKTSCSSAVIIPLYPLPWCFQRLRCRSFIVGVSIPAELTMVTWLLNYDHLCISVMDHLLQRFCLSWIGWKLHLSVGIRISFRIQLIISWSSNIVVVVSPLWSYESQDIH